MLIPKKLLYEVIQLSWSRETSYSPDKWTPDNPALGQCCVTALIIQEYLGGIIAKGKVGRFSHYWNILPDGDLIDLTESQFSEEEYRCLRYKETADRDSVLGNPPLEKRYYRLLESVETLLAQINALS